MVTMANDTARGRQATRPREIPAKGWKDVLLRVRDEMKDDRVSMVAASVAFYAMLAVFPALIALISLYGLVANPADVQAHMSSLASMLPADARSVVEEQLTSIVAQSRGGVGLGLAVSILGALWVASGGMRAVMEATNVAYDEQESRGFVRLRLRALLLTLAAIVFVLVALFAAAVLPVIFDTVGLGDTLRSALAIARWPLLAMLAIVALSALYRYAPARDLPRWRWVSWGSVVATLLWLAATALFSLYVSRFGNYNETYGALGGVIILMLWLYITAFAVLLGAELNAELEHQTKRDTTEGKPEPLGRRGANMADTVGPSRA